jgi:hypothetical protein
MHVNGVAMVSCLPPRCRRAVCGTRRALTGPPASLAALARPSRHRQNSILRSISMPTWELVLGVSFSCILAYQYVHLSRMHVCVFIIWRPLQPPCRYYRCNGPVSCIRLEDLPMEEGSLYSVHEKIF